MKDKIINLIKYNKITTLKIIIVFILIALSINIILSEEKGQEYPLISNEVDTINTSNDGVSMKKQIDIEIFVDIQGQVLKPGVIKVKDSSRIFEAIEIAGGLTKEADTSQINLSAKLRDEQKIYIPSINEGYNTFNGSYAENTKTDYNKNEYLININTSNKTQLQELSGIGPAMADRIIEYRNSIGQFNNVEDILNVVGIGEKTYSKFKDKICI